MLEGFAPSAEYIGEFFAICIVTTIFYFIKTRNRLTIQDLLSICICLFGLYKSNNFAGYNLFNIANFCHYFLWKNQN